MAEACALLLFAAAIVVCATTGVSVVFALCFGFFVFTGYGLFKGFTLRALFPMMMKGVKATAGIVIVMGLIGMLTGSWRASGTIARLVGDASGFISPAWSLTTVFLINGAVSTLLGTSFGTAATLGVISMTMTNAMGVDPFLTGGAVLAGVFVGDRCSPVSTSAALVAIVTHTSLYANIRRMLVTGALPMALAVLLWTALGFLLPGHAVELDITSVFARQFDLSLVTYVPAVILIGLVLCKTAIRWAMTASILAAVALCVFWQHMSWPTVAQTLIAGYTAPDAEVGAMLNGGGLISMVSVCLIVLISSTFSGLFEGTGLIRALETQIPRIARKITPFGTVFLTALVTSAVSCNQALAVLLTEQLSRPIYPNASERAAHLENTAIIIPPLIPWSIAGAVPIATIGAPATCVLAAFYLWLLPIVNFFVELRRGKSAVSSL